MFIWAIEVPFDDADKSARQTRVARGVAILRLLCADYQSACSFWLHITGSYSLTRA